MEASGATWALVTGASSGLGVELARGLARRGHFLVLTARNAAAMERLSGELAAAYGVQVVVEALDLSRSGSAEELCARLDARGIEPEIVVNNAGVGLQGDFVRNDPDQLAAMLQLNVISLTELSHIYARRMAAKARGRILLVASMAAYQPDPLLAVYGASKAYILSLGEALNVELRPHVGVTVLSPGLMDTGFNAASGYVTPDSLKAMILQPAKVAETGLQALFAGKPSVIAGRLNNMMAFAGRFFPRSMSAKATYNLGKRQTATSAHRAR